MRVLADENVPTTILAWLRLSGADVLAASESHSQWPDEELLELARSDDRIVLTTDLDFGELVFRQRLVSTGVVLLRLERLSIEQKLRVLADRWPRVMDRIENHFVVIGPTRTRIRPL